MEHASTHKHMGSKSSEQIQPVLERVKESIRILIFIFLDRKNICLLLKKKASSMQQQTPPKAVCKSVFFNPYRSIVYYRESKKTNVHLLD